MVEEESVTQKLQTKVDKLRLLNVANNIHNLTPPSRDDNDKDREIALVRALSVSPRIQEIFFEIRGLEYDPVAKEYVQVTEAIMNLEGAYKFVKILKNIAQETEWASYSEDEINSRIIHYFEINYPIFTFNYDRYDLETRNFNYLESTLQSFIDSCFHKSKSGKYINTLGRTYDEGVLKRALDTGESNKGRNEGFLSKMNPFKDRKWQ